MSKKTEALAQKIADLEDNLAMARRDLEAVEEQFGVLSAHRADNPGDLDAEAALAVVMDRRTEVRNEIEWLSAALEAKRAAATQSERQAVLEERRERARQALALHKERVAAVQVWAKQWAEMQELLLKIHKLGEEAYYLRRDARLGEQGGAFESLLIGKLGKTISCDLWKGGMRPLVEYIGRDFTFDRHAWSINQLIEEARLAEQRVRGLAAALGKLPLDACEKPIKTGVAA